MFCIQFYFDFRFNSNIGNLRWCPKKKKSRDLKLIPELSGDGVLGIVDAIVDVVVVVDGIVDGIGVDVGTNEVTEGRGVCP